MMFSSRSWSFVAVLLVCLFSSTAIIGVKGQITDPAEGKLLLPQFVDCFALIYSKFEGLVFEA